MFILSTALVSLGDLESTKTLLEKKQDGMKVIMRTE